jgi:hypothetical protein
LIEDVDGELKELRPKGNKSEREKILRMLTGVDVKG